MSNCCGSRGHTRSLLWKNFLLWRRTPKTSACELLCPLLLCTVLIYLRSIIEYQIMPSIPITEVTYDNSGDIQYSAVYHYPLVEEKRLKLRLEETWMEETYGFAGVIPRSRLMFIPKSCFWTGNFATQKRFVGLAPRNEYTESVAWQLERWMTLYKRQYGFRLQLEWKFFDSKEDMFEYVEHKEYMIDIENRVGLCFGISYSEETSGDGFTEHKFELHFDDQEQSDYANIPSQIQAAHDRFSNVPDFTSYYQYVQQGFNLMQNWCANSILRGKLFNLDASIISLVKPMRTTEFVKDDFVFAQQQILPLFMIVIFLLPIYRMISLIVSDRMMKTKDMTRSMGISESSYWLSWFIYYLIGITFVTVALAAMLTYGVFKYSAFGPILAILWLYGLSLFGYIVFVQAFFSKPTLASIVGSLLFFMSSFVDQIINDPYMDEHYKLLGSIMPSVAIQRCFYCVSEFERQREGLTWDTLSTQVLNYRIEYALIMMAFFFIYFTAIGIYFTQVLPGTAGGFREHFLFCFGVQLRQARFRRRQRRDRVTDLELDALTGRNFEAVKSEKYAQQREAGNVLKIQNLTKIYDKNIKAVDNLSMEMYGGEIYALLGHNGAGKTTTIQMVIGLLEASNGRMIFQNRNLAMNRRHLHHQIGVCPQENILYDSLTVMEHFRLFAALRQPKAPENRQSTHLQIEKLIKDLDLSDYRNTRAQFLSGGNKRKLQVGLAFVGDSCNLILLDEPTAGLDIAARRRMWDMLQAYKKDRVIILTTHYMDEAEILGDTIGIMAQGKLVCQGSTAFLTHRFETGSRITFKVQDKEGLTEFAQAYEKATNQDVRVEELDDYSDKFAINMP